MNSTQHLTGRELVNFVSFDRHIEEAVNEKSMFAHRLINQEDIPAIVDGLREWLIRKVGIFTTIGYYRSPDLGLWYETDALIEEFDELLLKFREYLVLEKAIDLQGEYSLLRYRDNLNFILFAGKPIGDLGPGFTDSVEESLAHYYQGFSNYIFAGGVKELNGLYDDDIDVNKFIDKLLKSDTALNLFKECVDLKIFME